jgi:hypothetical protein
MRVRHVPARHGARWVRAGLVVFMRKPLAFCVLMLMYLFLAPMVLFTVAPLATAGFMLATQIAIAGRFPMPDVFLAPLRVPAPQRWAQLKLGLAYAASILLIVWLADSFGRAPFDALNTALREGNKSPEDLRTLVGDAALHIAWMSAAITLVGVPFWHAPALVYWGRHGALQSLFFSTVACWRNKGAFTVYALGWGAVLIVFSFLSTTLFALIGMPQLALPFSMSAGLIVYSAFYASLYFTFADSFDVAADDSPGPLPLETP